MQEYGDQPWWLRAIIFIFMSIIGGIALLLRGLKFFIDNIHQIMMAAFMLWILLALSMCAMVMQRMP